VRLFWSDGPRVQCERVARVLRGVLVRFITGPAEVSGADLVVLRGTRSRVADLAWLREQGLDVPSGGQWALRRLP